MRGTLNLKRKIIWIDAQDSGEVIGSFVQALCDGHCPVILSNTKTIDLENRKKMNVDFAETWQAHPYLFGFLSSGSSGKRRLHLFELQKAFLNAQMHAKSLQMDQMDGDCVIYQALPLAHVFGLICYLMTPALLGCGLVLQDRPLGWAMKPDRKSGRKPVIHLVPAQLKILEQTWWLKQESLVSVGTDRAAKPILDRLCSKVAHLYVTYGLTEAGPRVASGRWDDGQPEGWIGNIFPEIQYRFSKNLSEQNNTLQIQSPTFALTAELMPDGYLDSLDVMQPRGSGAIFLSRSGERFKWRGRLYSMDMLHEVARRYQIRQKATLYVIEDLRLAIVSAAPLESGWKEVFSTLDLPFPEHFLVEQQDFDTTAKLDAVEILKKHSFPMNSAKIIYF
jgi:acyl-CoA synthetase (AMP-forming)/AMP-acid ligase II